MASFSPTSALKDQFKEEFHSKKIFKDRIQQTTNKLSAWGFLRPRHISAFITCVQDTEAGYSLLGSCYPAVSAGYEGGGECEAGEHYLHTVRLQHAASRSAQDHRRPGK